MRKRLIAFLLVSIVISSIFFISTGKMTIAEECNDCNQISTELGDAIIPENWNWDVIGDVIRNSICEKDIGMT